MTAHPTQPPRPTVDQLEATVTEVIRLGLSRLDDLAALDPDAADRVVRAIVADLQSRRPECVSSLAADWQPTETPRDPRTDCAEGEHGQP